MIRLPLLLVAFTLLSISTICCAQESVTDLALPESTEASIVATPESDPYKDMPKSGVLSGSYILGRESTAVDAPWGDQKSPYNQESPISGSVSRLTAKQWKAVVFNNSKDSFSVSVKVKQLDNRGTTVKTDNFTMSIKPNSSEDREMSSASSAVNAVLELVSWKKM